MDTTSHEVLKDVKDNKKGGKDLSKGLTDLKNAYSRVGDLHRKMKGASSAVEKADIKNKHLYDMGKVKQAIKVFKVEVLKANDLKTYRQLLTWERQRNIIGVSDEYALNKMEADTLEENCECFNAPPSGLRCSLGGKYRFISYFDEARQKEMYITYIPVVIAPESQIDQKLEWKMAQGFMPEMKDYPEAKILWKRRVLVDSEWSRYFREI
jgi:hypothetical protein